MDPYVLIHLIPCVVCTAYSLSGSSGPATPDDRIRRLHTRGLMGLFALYTGLAALIHLDLGPALDAFGTRTAAVVLIAIGPAAVATCFRLALRPHRTARRRARLLYVVGALLAAVELATGSVYSGIADTRFGRQSMPGPMFMPVVTFVIGCGVFAFVTLSRALADSPAFDAAARPMSRMMRWSVMGLIALSAATDVVLPLAGVPAPRLSSIGFGLVALTALWALSARDGGNLTATPALISEHILHALNDGVAFLDVAGRVLLANESLGHLVGDDPRRLIGHPLDAHLPGFDLAGARDQLDVDCELYDVGGRSHAVSMSLSTVRDGRGTPLGRVVVLRDVRELKTLKSRLVMSGRLAAVGQMAAGIAHEINNPISFVRTNLGVLREHWQTLDTRLEGEARDADVEDVLKDGEELIAESVEGIDRAAAIVRDVRELSHAGPAGRVDANLNHILERVIRLASSEMGPGISIERRFGDHCRAHISPDQMTQVFVNLLTNAIHAVDGRGHIVVESRRHEDRVEVSVIDDGAGVPEEIRDRIFDPFYTTKQVGDGTGLGLSISHEIVRGHGGELHYAPNPEGGACFTVHLDAAPDGGTQRRARR